jgi:hypothetical protein
MYHMYACVYMCVCACAWDNATAHVTWKKLVGLCSLLSFEH